MEEGTTPSGQRRLRLPCWTALWADLFPAKSWGAPGTAGCATAVGAVSQPRAALFSPDIHRKQGPLSLRNRTSALAWSPGRCVWRAVLHGRHQPLGGETVDKRGFVCWPGENWGHAPGTEPCRRGRRGSCGTQLSHACTGPRRGGRLYLGLGSKKEPKEGPPNAQGSSVF